MACRPPVLFKCSSHSARSSCYPTHTHTWAVPGWTQGRTLTQKQLTHKGAGPISTFKAATVTKDYSQLTVNRRARRSECHAQDQVMGPWGPAEGEEAGPQREGRGPERGRQETVQVQREQALGDVQETAKLIYTSYFFFL